MNQDFWANPKPRHHIFGVLFFGANKNHPQTRTLVGGFNPFEKYESNWKFSPNSGMKMKNIWNHQLEHLNQHVRPFAIYLYGPFSVPEKKSTPKIQHFINMNRVPLGVAPKPGNHHIFGAQKKILLKNSALIPPVLMAKKQG